jgi:two-component system response regulator FlrC
MRVSNGQFREDLYYRINVFPIKIPPLRDRPGDILALAERYLLKYRESMGFPHANFTSECRRVLTTYRWPGNVRELENTVQRGLLLCDGFDIKPADIDLGFTDTAITEPTTANSKGLPESAIANSKELLVPNTVNANRLSEPGENNANSDRASSEVKTVGPNANSALAPKSAHEDLLQDLGVGSSDEEYSEAILGNSDIKQVERDHIIAVLKKVNGSRRKAVELLGISERTLRYKIKHWRASGIDIP